MACNHCKDFMDLYANTVLGSVPRALRRMQTKQHARIKACVRGKASDLVRLISNFLGAPCCSGEGIGEDVQY